MQTKAFLKIRLLLLLLLKEVGSARLRESDIHPISPKTPASQYQPVDRKNRWGKIVEDYSRDSLLYTEPAKSFQRDTERGTKVLRYCEVLQRGGA